MNARPEFTQETTEAAPDNPLNYDARRVNEEKLRSHNYLLGQAGSALESAHQTAYAIECLSRMLVADGLERDRFEDGQPLNPYLRGGLNAAIGQLAKNLHSNICDRVSHNERQIDEQAGGGRNEKYLIVPSTLKRVQRSNAQLDQLDQLDQQIVDVLQEDHPQSVRHVFYRMTDPRLPEPVEKSDRGYRHVQDQCVKLRRSGRVRYDWIADISRRGYFVDTFSDKRDFLSRVAGLYRADLWELSAYRCEVWCESRSIASRTW